MDRSGTGKFGSANAPSLVRDLIEFSYPKDFKNYNARMSQPGGFYRSNDAHERIWNTKEKKAVFTNPDRLNALSFEDREGRFRLITMRSNDHFNTTIYGYSDRFRGIEGTRDVVLMCEEDIAEAGLTAGDIVTIVSDFGDGKRRELRGLTVTPTSCREAQSAAIIRNATS